MSKDWNGIMFDNVGKKIKAIAKAIAWIIIVLSIISGAIMFVFGLLNFRYVSWMIFAAPICVVLGCLAAWLTVITAYGFGEIVDKICSIDRTTRDIKRNTRGEIKSETQAQADDTRFNRIEKLRSLELITEEEYRLIMSHKREEE